MMSNYYRNLLEGYTCIKMKSLSIEQAYKLTQPDTYSSKILKIQSTNQKSNWTSGGGTYQGATPPKISSKDGLSKEINNHEQEQQEFELEQVFRCFFGREKRLPWVWWPGVAPGLLQVSLCPFFRGKIYFEFSGIFRETLFWPIFRV